MKFKKHFSFFLIFILLFYTGQLHAQQDSLIVQLSDSIIKPGDTLFIGMGLLAPEPGMNKATVNCVIKNGLGFEKKMRWPLLNRLGSAELAIDKDFPPGFYDFYFSVEPRIFSILGHVNAPKKVTALLGLLVTKNKQMILVTAPVDDHNNFEVKNYLFEDLATIFFSAANRKTKYLDIVLQTPLDSTVHPLNITARKVYIGAGTPVPFSTQMQVGQKDTHIFNGEYILPEVVLYSQAKSMADKYDEQYVSGLFKDNNSRTFNVMDDPLAASRFDVIDYLQTTLPNLQVTTADDGTREALLRDVPVQFYVDEVQLDFSFVQSLSVSDVAIIKFIPAPFVGNIGGRGAAIAIYTRRGDEIRPSQNGNHIFRVKGYTSLQTVLAK